jgi:hypothetical protein
MKTHLGIAVVALLGACLFLGWRLFAQIHNQDSRHQQLTVQGMSLQDLQMMRHDIQKQKQKLIAENLPMVEPEAIKFWAVYQKYSAELKQINDEKFAMIHAYSQRWKSMSDDDALIFTRRWLELDESAVQLRSKYLPLVREALPGKKTATFFQLDQRITMMIDLQFASQLPLLHGIHGQAQAAAPIR